ncbi:MAG: hypothetical protein EBU06_06455 [Micrococcales bacterium]|nr:hypothetical protein [Micrococcales bacterium]
MGLTTISDIDILYKQVQDLKQDIASNDELKKVEYSDTIDHIIERLRELELRVFEERVLQLDDSSWENIILKRNYILKSTDWTVTSGCTVDQAAWVAYRQKLRDLPQTFAGVKLSEVSWPKAPSTAGPHSKKSK